VVVPVNGHEQDPETHSDEQADAWYRIRDEMTGEPKGFITKDGETRETDRETTQKVQTAFARDLITKDNEVVEELGGVCFDGVCTIAPIDPAHNRMVLQNLGALTGLRPERVGEKDDDTGTNHPD
jgi:hypothetical protein